MFFSFADDWNRRNFRAGAVGPRQTGRRGGQHPVPVLREAEAALGRQI